MLFQWTKSRGDFGMTVGVMGITIWNSFNRLFITVFLLFVQKNEIWKSKNTPPPLDPSRGDLGMTLGVMGVTIWNSFNRLFITVFCFFAKKKRNLKVEKYPPFTQAGVTLGWLWDDCGCYGCYHLKQLELVIHHCVFLLFWSKSRNLKI